MKAKTKLTNMQRRDGEMVRVTPDDATVLMMLHLPGSFEFIGPTNDR
jgi:hypothetical protein